LVLASAKFFTNFSFESAVASLNARSKRIGPDGFEIASGRLTSRLKD
jgi:hypothetical protein